MKAVLGLSSEMRAAGYCACLWFGARAAAAKSLRSIVFIGTLLFCTTPLLALSEPQQSPAAPSFWRVEGRHNTLWLFGTIHVLTEAHYPLAASIERAFQHSPNLVVEVDVLNMDQAAFQQLLVAEGRLESGTTLADVLGAERYRRARELASAAGYDIGAMQQLHPWLVMLMVSMNEYMRMGYTPEQGVETYLLSHANRTHKNIVELESLASQISVFSDMEESTEVAALMHTLENLEDIQIQIRDLVGAWEAGNLDNLEQHLMAEFAAFPGAYQSLITDRNRDWVEQLKVVLDQSTEDHFVAVGALHMIGSQGVVNLLRKQGYSVVEQ